MMDGRTLEYFARAYEEHNFAQAAKLIPISPQGLAKAIRSLEKELEAPLFDNSTGAQIPTEYGVRLYRYALEHRQSIRELHADFDTIRRFRSGAIRIGACIGVMGVVPFSVFDDFQAAYPNVRVEREDIPDYLCDERLRDGYYDMAFTLWPYADEFETIELYRDSHFIWMASTDPLAQKDAVAIEDLEGKALHSVGPEYKGHNELQRLLESKGVRLGKSTVSGEMDWLHHMAGTGEGLSLTVRHKAELFGDDRSITARPVPELPWRFGLSYKKGRALSAHERAFTSFCIRLMDQGAMPR